jgi:hypothetical protein
LQRLGQRYRAVARVDPFAPKRAGFPAALACKDEKRDNA